MLYVTTRNNRDAFTAQRTLTENRCSDGGLYLPFHTPKLPDEQIASLADRSFNQNVADILNLLFNTKLTSWDIDFCTGRYPVRLAPLSHRIQIAEAWHNPDWEYSRMVNGLAACLCREGCFPSNWLKIAVRIAVLFGIFGELQRTGINSADISVVSGDFSAPISAWYARQWGLPIQNIVCCCNENNQLWDLFCHGHLRTDAVSLQTSIPEADISLPDDLERLIYACGGTAEVNRYLEACRQGLLYYPGELILSKLRKGQYISVVSSQRVETTIPSVYRTHGYLLSPGSALAYAGLLDYRAKTGSTQPAIVFSEKNPVCTAAFVANTLGISEEEFKRHL